MVIGVSIRYWFFNTPYFSSPLHTHIMELTWQTMNIACRPSGSLEATEALIKEHGATTVAVWRAPLSGENSVSLGCMLAS